MFASEHGYYAFKPSYGHIHDCSDTIHLRITDDSEVDKDKSDLSAKLGIRFDLGSR